MMGLFAARLPGDRRYARNHMWCAEVKGGSASESAAAGRFRFGFTAYAVRLMQDVYFLDWQASPGDALPQLGPIGHIETSKAVADLFAPIRGRVDTFNKELLKDPTPINIDNYGDGWLFEMTGDASTTLSTAEYYQFLDANWEKTQRQLKGHM
jgi:glycine cleavage system H protein